MTTGEQMKLAGMIEALAVQTVGGDQYGPPLLKWLRDAMGAGAGDKTPGGGKSVAERSVMNLAAFNLWEDLTGQIASQFAAATDMRPNRAPEVNLLAWWAVFSAAAARGDVTELQLTVATGRVEDWVKRIRDHFDPPMARELIIPCPECGEERVRTGVGELEVLSFALEPFINLDGELTVQCRHCRARWVGPVEVIQLGRQAGMEIDVEAIREARMPAGVTAA